MESKSNGLKNRMILGSIIIILIVSGVWAIAAPSFNTIIDPGGMVTDAMFTIYPDAGTYYLRNGVTGEVTTNAVATVLIDGALSALTAGRLGKEKIVLKGDITFTTPVNVTDGHVAIEIQGRLYMGGAVGEFFWLQSIDDVEIYGGEMVASTTVNTAGIIVLGVASSPSKNIFIHDIMFNTLYFGIQIRSYVNIINISNIQGTDCIITIGTSLGITSTYNCNINNVIAKRNTVATVYAVSIDGGCEYFNINNIIGNQTGSVAIASSRHVTVNNAISKNFPAEGGEPAFNIETTPTYQTTDDIQISNIIVRNAGAVGIRVGILTTIIKNVKLSNCYSYNSTDDGIRIYNVQGGQFVNCETNGGAIVGFNIDGDIGVGNLQFTNCKSNNSATSGWYLAGVQAGFFELIGCVGNGAVANDGMLIGWNTADGIRLINCRWENNGQWGVRIGAATITNTIIRGCVFSGNGVAPILDGGTNTMPSENSGYVTENSGTGSVDNGATSDFIWHGLSYTPAATDIHYVFTENPTNTIVYQYIGNISTTGFTLYTNNPGISNLDFSWAVRKTP